MIDREARDKLAELLRHAASGRATCDQIEEAFQMESNDPAIKRALFELEEFWYDLIPDPPFKPDRLRQREVARLVMFLYSEAEYIPPPPLGKPVLILALATVTGIAISVLSAFLQVLFEGQSWLSPVLEISLYAGLFLLIGAGIATVLYVAGGILVAIARELLSWHKSEPFLDISPFQNEADYQWVLQHPRLLNG